MGTTQRDTPSWPAIHRKAKQVTRENSGGRGEAANVKRHEIAEHFDVLRLGQDIRQVGGSLYMYHDKDQTRNKIAQALRIPQDVLGLAEGYGIIGEIDATLRIGPDAGGRSGAVS